MNILFLDDDSYRCAKFRSAVPSATIVNDAASCISSLHRGWDVVFLDHDLGGTMFQDQSEENSGSAVVRWILDNDPILGKIVVHSLNEPARKAMCQDLANAGYKVRSIPFISFERLINEL